MLKTPNTPPDVTRQSLDLLADIAKEDDKLSRMIKVHKVMGMITAPLIDYELRVPFYVHVWIGAVMVNALAVNDIDSSFISLALVVALVPIGATAVNWWKRASSKSDEKLADEN